METSDTRSMVQSEPSSRSDSRRVSTNLMMSVRRVSASIPTKSGARSAAIVGRSRTPSRAPQILAPTGLRVVITVPFTSRITTRSPLGSWDTPVRLLIGTVPAFHDRSTSLSIGHLGHNERTCLTNFLPTDTTHGC